MVVVTAVVVVVVVLNIEIVVCESEWRLAGGPVYIDNITVVPSTQEFYQTNKDQVFVCLSVCLSVCLTVSACQLFQLLLSAVAAN